MPLKHSELASRSQRFLNCVLDTLGIGAFGALFGVLFGLFAALTGGSTDEGIALVDSWLFGIAVFVSYYLFFETLYARTPGKFLTGTRVVTADGREATFAKVLSRTITRLVPFEPLSFLGRNSVRPKGWHDSWSNTRVVRVAGRRRTGTPGSGTQAAPSAGEESSLAFCVLLGIAVSLGAGLVLALIELVLTGLLGSPLVGDRVRGLVYLWATVLTGATAATRSFRSPSLVPAGVFGLILGALLMLVGSSMGPVGENLVIVPVAVLLSLTVGWVALARFRD